MNKSSVSSAPASINFDIYEAIKSFNSESFTVQDLCNVLVSKHKITATEAIRSQKKRSSNSTFRLFSRKLLTREKNSDGLYQYNVTDKFLNTKFEFTTPERTWFIDEESTPIIETDVQETQTRVQQAQGFFAKNKDSSSKNTAQLEDDASLRQKLNRYEDEIHTLAGRCEEFKNLMEDFPNLTHQLMPLYIESRNRCANLKGRIEALTAVLKLKP